LFDYRVHANREAPLSKPKQKGTTMLKTVLSLIAVALAAVLAYAATKPDTFRVQRSTHINASPETIFPHIDTLANWPAWSPWEKMDPSMKKTASGPTHGKGAAVAWDGNSDVGTGRMEITDSIPPSKITFSLNFLKPFEAHNTAEFTLEHTDDGTHVTWAMFGPQGYLMKLMSVFVDCDQMIGKDFEAGLAALKTVAEK
jgi:uncharacterized protein YndB with AHSA1/START domain